MRTLRHRSALFAAFLLLLALPMACKKDKEAAPPRVYIAAFTENLDVAPRYTVITYSVNDLMVGGTAVTVGSGSSGGISAIELSDDKPYSFTLKKEVYVAGGTTTNSSSTHTGTIAKALFTDTSTPNALKISVTNSLPTLYLNGVRLADPTSSNGSGGGTGGSNTCPLGTWLTSTCGPASGKNLIYNFGPGGVGYTENPDCNGICGNLKYNFRYAVSGNTITYTFTSVDPVVCSGTSRQPPLPNPAGPYSITYTCGNNGNQLVTEATNTQTGVRTTLTFARR